MKKIISSIALSASIFCIAQSKCDQFKSFTDIGDMLEVNAKCDISLHEKYNNYRYIFEKNVEYDLSKQLPNLTEQQLAKVTREFLHSLDVKKYSKQQRINNTKKIDQLAKVYSAEGMYKPLQEFYGLSAYFSFKAMQKSKDNVTITYNPTVYKKDGKQLIINLN